MKKTIITLIALGITEVLYSQKADSLKVKNLDSVTITSYLRQPTISRLPDVQGTYIFSGKKTEVINLVASDIDITNKNARQVFAKVPGIFVYDMDGSGNQVNISSRGLDPHRGWDFNIRKDGIITNSDMYGYPASHYSMPLESISKVEIARGTASLQYGAQFGGMLNYISKKADSTRPFSFESINTVGSYNLISTYNAFGGKKGRFSYYAYYYQKRKNGYRDNEQSKSEAQQVTFAYDIPEKLSVKLEWARSKYLYQIPGQLNDSMFHENPRQSTRSRNYFSPDIHVPSLKVLLQLPWQMQVEWISSAVMGRRKSVMFDKPVTIRDSIVTDTHEYNNRQVDIDRFHSITNEMRLLKHYSVKQWVSTLAAGIQFMNNNLGRTQLGKGTTGTDYSTTLVDPVWGRDLHFKTSNIAVYAENNLQLSKTLSLNAGFRVESGKTDLSGTITYYPENEVPVSVSHHFPLFGAGFSYKPIANLEFYGGWSQAYRPMLFKDLIPTSLFERVDPEIEDAKGYNIESGVRLETGMLKWDISTFATGYNNRFGTLSQTDNNGDFYTYRTNIGNSLTLGIEVFVQGDWVIGNKIGISAFTSTSIMNARYKNAVLKSGNENVNIDGNKVESAPDIITRNGITFKFKRSSVSALYSYTGKSFADALNTVVPSNTGAVGLVPAYGLFDLNASWRLFDNLIIRASLNNAFNKQYFTKRPAFYPGPGVWPSDGRNLNVSFVFEI